MEVDIYRDEFLIERPMLACLRRPEETVLLIDEIDRSDHEFEAFLLEFLSDFQISIPERGSIRAYERPVVILTSNRTRELRGPCVAAAFITGSTIQLPSVKCASS